MSQFVDDLSAEELFGRGRGVTYSDFSILDTFLTEIEKEEISFATTLGKGVDLQLPIIASPMDTVTNAKVCIALAQHGGIGVIDYNFKDPSGQTDVSAQIEELEKVKRSQSGLIESPITVHPGYTIAQAIEEGKKFKTGRIVIDTFPVTEDGKPNGRLVGLLRKQDYRKNQHTDLKVHERMVPLEKLVLAEWPITLKEANQKLWDEHVSYLPILDKAGNLKYLVTQTDIEKYKEFPLATKDDKKRLRVLFAVETRPEIAYERLERGFGVGADGVVVDTSQGFTKYAKQIIEYIIKTYPEKLVIGGNISTAQATRFLDELGVNSFRCGQGPGSICSTAGALGISRAGAKGVYATGREIRREKLGIKNIADGGLKEVGDIVKALAVGAHCVMLGNLLAGSEEGPGEITADEKTGMPVKVYRGMGSKEANVGGIRGYSRLPQGVKGRVPYRGSLHEWIPLIKDGMLSAFHTLNCKTIDELHDKLYWNQLRFEERTEGSRKEAGIHDLV